MKSFPRKCMCGMNDVMCTSSLKVVEDLTSWLASPAGITKRAFNALPVTTRSDRRLLREDQPNAGAVFGRFAVGRVVHLENDVRTRLYQSRSSRRKDHSGLVRRDAAQLTPALLSFAGRVASAPQRPAPEQMR